VLERNGLADLILALGMLEHGRFELEIVGAGADEPALRDLADGQGLGDLVRFRRPVDGAALAQRYREADLFTMAPWEASFGDVFAQALASGLPIVGSAVGGIPELVRHGRNGLLVPPRSPRELAGAIRHLAELPALRAEIGRRNRTEAEANLSWERTTTRYLSIYNGVQRQALARRALTELPSGTW
jgi:glycosyltransferase involved in cell wall biosynthesis